tara:strand:+ start:295 stop:648 length:354 start_codon:yes stop_codon:yes gene_type:complete
MNFLESKDHSVFLKQEFYFKKIKKQLAKDFNDADFDIEVDLISIYRSSTLLDLVQRSLEHLFHTNVHMFFQLMYRIDIPDADFKMQVSDSGINFESLTDLVIRRELIKVLIREKYSG